MTGSIGGLGERIARIATRASLPVKPMPLSQEWFTFRVLIVGGDERQHELEARVNQSVREKGWHINVTHLPTGWSGNWSKTLDDALRCAERSNGVVLLRFMRTEFGRSLRAQLKCPWVGCPGVGVLQVSRMVRKVADWSTRH